MKNYIAFEYTNLHGILWTGDIELIKGDVMEAVESALLTFTNITPNRKIEGDVVAHIYSDKSKLNLLDTLTWTKTSKENYLYILNEGECDEKLHNSE